MNRSKLLSVLLVVAAIVGPALVMACLVEVDTLIDLRKPYHRTWLLGSLVWGLVLGAVANAVARRRPR